MNQSLRAEYLTLLKGYGIRPFSIPPDFREIHIKVLEQKLANSTDEEINALYREALEREHRAAANNEPLDDERTPGAIILEKYNANIEAMVRHNKRYGPSYADDIYVGEFPTGSVNAEARRTPHGHLILINAGLTFLIQQVVETLNTHSQIKDVLASEEVLATLASIVVAYLRFGDPVYGPKPITGGYRAMRSQLLTRTCCEFVLAHEYGHILAGHLAGDSPPTRALNTPNGEIQVIQSSWEQEFEADRIGYELTLGGRDAEEVDFTVIDSLLADKPLPPRKVGEPDPYTLIPALTAPLLFFQLDMLLTDVWRSIHADGGSAHLTSTHPPSDLRMRTLMDAFEWIPKRYMKLIAFPAALRELHGAVAARATELARPGDG